MSTITPITWKGNQVFRLSASGLHEDTVRIVPSARKSELMLRLVLPTLCITYADMTFQNAVGGAQEGFPASRAYGPVFFDPPVEIHGAAEVERLTYIRGAQHVSIGPESTIIEFGAWNDLIVPRLRLDLKEPAEVDLQVPETAIQVDEPLTIQVMQFADGRHVGGVRLEKRHPDYKPPEIKPRYDLWIRVIDGTTLEPIPEARVNVWHWDERLPTPAGRGGFALADALWTDGSGSVEFKDRPSGELEAYTVALSGWHVAPRCLRPLAGQQVRLHMRAWPLQPDTRRHTWRAGDRLEPMAQLTGRNEKAILRLNRLAGREGLMPGMRLSLPCYAGNIRLEPWDDPDRVGARFGYGDARGLAELNGLRDLSEYDPVAGLKLPDWRFVYAREKDTLDTLDRMFGLPRGSCLAVGQVFRPRPTSLFAGETVAVPSQRQAERMAKR